MDGNQLEQRRGGPMQHSTWCNQSNKDNNNNNKEEEEEEEENGLQLRNSMGNVPTLKAILNATQMEKKKEEKRGTLKLVY